MDFHQNPDDGPRNYQYAQYRPPQSDKRSNAMTIAAVIFSILAASTTCCIYFSIVCGALGVTFALLSKGGELTMSKTASTALWLSVGSMALTVFLTGIAFASVISQYGSLDAFADAYMKMLEDYSGGLTY